MPFFVFLSFVFFFFKEKILKKNGLFVSRRGPPNRSCVYRKPKVLYVYFLEVLVGCFWLMCSQTHWLVRDHWTLVRLDLLVLTGGVRVTETTCKNDVISMIKLMTKVFVDDQQPSFCFGWCYSSLRLFFSRMFGVWRNWSCWIISHSREMVSDAQ